MREQEGGAGPMGPSGTFRPSTPEVARCLTSQESTGCSISPTLLPASLSWTDPPRIPPPGSRGLHSPPPTGGHSLHPMNLPPAFSPPSPLSLPFRDPRFCLSLPLPSSQQSTKLTLSLSCLGPAMAPQCPHQKSGASHTAQEPCALGSGPLTSTVSPLGSHQAPPPTLPSFEGP